MTVNITVIYSFWSAMFEVLLLLSFLEQFACNETFDIVWAEQPERELLRGDENMVAFRDIAFEVMMRKILVRSQIASVRDRSEIKGTCGCP